MCHLFWYSKEMGLLGGLTLLFGIAHDINHSKQVDIKLAQMKKDGWGIRVIDKDGKIKIIQG